MIIQEVPFESALYKQTKHFREDILRLPLGLTLSPQDVQGEEQQIHIAALGANDAILGTIILKPLSSHIVKLRQMAVAPAMQGQGIGRDLVRFAEGLARARGFQSMEMSARISAKGFYEKLGYRATGDAFTEVTVPTIKMIKDIRESNL